MEKEPMKKLKKHVYRLWDTHIHTRRKPTKTKSETVIQTQKICSEKQNQNDQTKHHET